MKVTKDGQEYYLNGNGVITEEGIYNISFSNEVNTVESYSDEELAEINEIRKEAEEQEDSIINEMDVKSGDTKSENQLQFTIDKTAPEVIKLKSNIAIEDNPVNAEEFVLASDKYGNLFYSYVNEPNWSKVGKQNINIQISDAAGNNINKEVAIAIYDKCDVDNSGIVDIMDVAVASLKYNEDNSSITWNKRFDFNKDGIIDIFDISLLAKRI